MESLHYIVTDSYGHYITDLWIPFSELYFVKQTFVCDVQWNQLVLY